MAQIKPFKGIRPPQKFVEEVASRPYDVLNSEEARTEAAGNEKSLYHIIKPEIDFPSGTDEHDERVYAKAAENFQKFQFCYIQQTISVLYQNTIDAIPGQFLFFQEIFCFLL